MVHHIGYNYVEFRNFSSMETSFERSLSEQHSFTRDSYNILIYENLDKDDPTMCRSMWEEIDDYVKLLKRKVLWFKRGKLDCAYHIEEFITDNAIITYLWNWKFKTILRYYAPIYGFDRYRYEISDTKDAKRLPAGAKIRFRLVEYDNEICTGVIKNNFTFCDEFLELYPDAPLSRLYRVNADNQNQYEIHHDDIIEVIDAG